MLTTGDVAKLFHVSAQTVINWLDQGRIPFERIGRGPRRLTESNVLKYIQDLGISVEALEQTVYEQILHQTRPSQDSMPLPVIVLDREARVLSWNEGAALLYGFGAGEMVGFPIDRIPTRLSGSSSGLEYALHSEWQENTLELDALQETRGGKPLTVHMIVSRFYAEASVTAGFVLVCLNKGR